MGVFDSFLGMRSEKLTLGYILSVRGARCEAKPKQRVSTRYHALPLVGNPT
jgi:hypothetical protein